LGREKSESVSQSVTTFSGFGQILKGHKKSSKLNFDMPLFAACSLYRDLLNGSKISSETSIEAKVKRLEKQHEPRRDNIPTPSERLLGGGAATAAAGAR